MNSSETSRMVCSSCFCLRLRSVSVVLTETLATDSSDEGGGVRFSRVEDNFENLGEHLGDPEPGAPGESGGSAPLFVRPTDRYGRLDAELSPLDFDTILDDLMIWANSLKVDWINGTGLFL